MDAYIECYFWCVFLLSPGCGRDRSKDRLAKRLLGVCGQDQIVRVAGVAGYAWGSTGTLAAHWRQWRLSAGCSWSSCSHRESHGACHQRELGAKTTHTVNHCYRSGMKGHCDISHFSDGGGVGGGIECFFFWEFCVDIFCELCVYVLILQALHMYSVCSVWVFSVSCVHIDVLIMWVLCICILYALCGYFLWVLCWCTCLLCVDVPVCSVWVFSVSDVLTYLYAPCGYF